jgi:Tol biopolymer transport system component
MHPSILALFSSVVVMGSLGLACTTAGTSSGGAAPPGSSADGGPGSSSGTPGSPGSAAGALPTSTFLYVSTVAPSRGTLVAFDVASGQAHPIMDTRGDGSSEGWSIDGYTLSPDRTRIAMASLYGPTKEDVDTKLATQRIWSFATDGSDMRRLTPVFPNTAAGRNQFVIEVRNPSFSQTGADVFYGYGEYFYEGTKLQGGSGIWSVNAAGGHLPNLFDTQATCSFVDPSVDPKTGNIAIIHSVCVGSQSGIYLYAEGGSAAPEKLVGSDYGTLDVALEPPRWVADGSGFLFVATTTVKIGGSDALVRGLFAFDMTTRKPSPVVVPQEADTYVVDGAIAPDGSAVVYCLRQGEATNLHVIDLTKDPATDAALTNDGKSCHPVW